MQHDQTFQEFWSSSYLQTPKFLLSTPEVGGTSPDYTACSSQGGFQGSWTKTDGHTHSYHSHHAPHCRRPSVCGSLAHNWWNTKTGQRETLGYGLSILLKFSWLLRNNYTFYCHVQDKTQVGALNQDPITSVHSPVIQINSHTWVLQLSEFTGFLWSTQNISWTSSWFWSTHSTTRRLWPDPQDLLHWRGRR